MLLFDRFLSSRFTPAVIRTRTPRRARLPWAAEVAAAAGEEEEEREAAAVGAAVEVEEEREAEVEAAAVL